MPYISFYRPQIKWLGSVFTKHARDCTHLNRITKRSASADGFGQGEGCGMIALKRLSDAQADGDTVLALVQGSAVNHDGQARTVTTPSGPAQRDMLKDALSNARLKAHQIDFVETHGTGIKSFTTPIRR